ncbi:MAG: hypothetical protein WDM92_01475 [Caulobacteraceae bacterium]
MIIAFTPDDAEAARLAWAAPRAAVNAAAFWRDGAFDAEGFAAAVRLWTIALDLQIEADGRRELASHRPLALAVAGCGELLVRRGLAHGLAGRTASGRRRPRPGRRGGAGRLRRAGRCPWSLSRRRRRAALGHGTRPSAGGGLRRPRRRAGRRLRATAVR